MKYNYGRLVERIKDKKKTQKELSKSINIGRTSLNQRLNNKSEFNQSEITKIMQELEIDIKDVAIYFFEQKV